MNITTVDEARLKDVVKTALLEVFEERRDWLSDLLSEALLDIGLGYAIQEGEQTPTVSREERKGNCAASFRARQKSSSQNFGITRGMKSGTVKKK
ncbi:MAG: hypothetical protein ISS50_05160 [Anaerolineae bacterium]|nr:hypothetical protein [Anaerolineae bacterium]